MIKLYTAGTSNGHRAAIGLEEAAAAHEARVLDLPAGQQREAEYRAINPAGQISAIVHRDARLEKSVTITQSAAILFYAARKKRGTAAEDSGA